MALTNFLCGVGVVVLYTVSPERGARQAMFYAMGLAAMLVMSEIVFHVRHFRGLTLLGMALGIGALIERYKEVQHDFHRGVILPVGDEPSGRSWTGFQSVDGERGYLIFFREQNPDRKARIETWLPENSKVRLTPVLGSGKAAVQKTGRRGTLEVELPAPNDYTMYRYELIR